MRFVFVLLWCLCASVASATGLFDKLSGLGGGQQQEFLPVEKAFALTVKPIDSQTLEADLQITEGYYLYRDRISFDSKTPDIKVQAVNLPKGEIKQDPSFGPVEVYHHSIKVEIKLERAAQAAATLALDASYQGCSDKGLCYPPVTPTLEIQLPAAGVATAVVAASPVVKTTAPALPVSAASSSQSEESQIAHVLKQGDFWLNITFFFGAGLLLAFTPCIFPMVPILSGIIVGRGHHITKMHAFILSFSYVLGMSITYALAGIAAGLSGDMLSGALQTPAVLGSFAALFVILSLAMFGFYDLQLPSSLQSKLSDTSNRLHGGHLSGVFLMGALSAVIVGPCVAAPLAGALIYISQTHDAVFGGVALFSLALGMGAPLLLIGTSAGALLPKAGAWMESVKKFFGVILLGLAVWIIHPLLPTSLHMLSWSILLIFSAVYLRALEPLAHNAHGWHKFFKALGWLSLLVGVAYLIGALSGAPDMLRPLGALGRAEAAATSGKLHFEHVKNESELNQKLAQAKGKVVMLDFYADWCVACKEMEATTFSDAAVQAKLKSATLIKLDVTANNEDDKALLKRFGVFGPPVMVFFDTQGQERSDVRVTGYQNAEQFLQGLQRIGL